MGRSRRAEGPKPVMVGGLAVFAAASAAFVIGGDPHLPGAARFAQGTGAAAFPVPRPAPREFRPASPLFSGQRGGPVPMTTSRTSASPPARPLSPALDKTFKIGLVLKGLDGILEVAGGILLLFLSPHAIEHIARSLTAHELSEDPHDVIARYILHTSSHLTTSTTLFGAIYLLSHGAAKIVVVALVLRDKLWAYPWLIVLLLAFIVYQLYRLTVVHFSVGLTALTVFDVVLVWLTWREYQAKRAPRPPGKIPAA